VLPLDAAERQLWTNAFLTFPKHGLLLRALSDTERAAALTVIGASLSAPGLAQATEAVRLNGAR
jgi:hypothetical protein